MNVFQSLQHRFVQMACFQKPDTPLSLCTSITATPPRHINQGDIAFNGAMVLSKFFNSPPMVLAEQFASTIKTWDHVTAVQAAPPGFINVWLSNDFWQQQLKLILKYKERYGHSLTKKKEKINVEYVSVNPTGPMHIGHSRGAIVGDVLANLFEACGHPVTREFYINDSGSQAVKLTTSVYARYLEALGASIDLKQLDYPGTYLIPVGVAAAEKYGKQWTDSHLSWLPHERWLSQLRPYVIKTMMASVQKDLALLDIHHDVFVSEQKIIDEKHVVRAVDELQKQGHLYEGALCPPQGQLQQTPPQSRLVFRATTFGDDKDRSLTKEDGQWTYFAKDIAYHCDKIQRGHERLINVWGADHGGYVKRLDSAIQAVSNKKSSLKVLLCHVVSFLKGGVPVKMSKRHDQFLSIKDLLSMFNLGDNSVGVLRFMMMTRHHHAPFAFDCDAAVAESQDNPMFYVQYAHARTHSVMNQARSLFPDLKTTAEELSQADFSLLTQEDFDLIKGLCRWPDCIKKSLETLEPHRLSTSIQEIATQFHHRWTEGKHKGLRFIDLQNPQKTKARLAIVAATAVVLRSGLHLLGVKPVKQL